MKTIAYLRVSKDSQDVGNQRLAILEFARQEKFEVSAFMELSVSSRRSPKARQIDLLMARLEPGDTLVVSELSRMGRSVGEVISTVDALLKQQVRFLAIKEGIRLAGKQDLHSKVMVTLFGLFAEIERELISMRTKEGLAAARASGQTPGASEGTTGTVKAQWQGRRNSKAPGPQGLKGVDCQDHRSRPLDALSFHALSPSHAPNSMTPTTLAHRKTTAVNSARLNTVFCSIATQRPNNTHLPLALESQRHVYQKAGGVEHGSDGLFSMSRIATPLWMPKPIH